jgi:hypothetical protein
MWFNPYVFKNAVPLPLDGLSAGAKSSVSLAFSLKRLFTTYAGPVVKVRRNTDNVISDFYSDGNANLVNGSGTSYATWVGGDVGCVQTWYNQVGNGKDATQATATLQPRLIPSSNVLDFANTSTTSTNGYLNMPNRTVPANNTGTTAIYKIGNIGTVGTGGENGIVTGGSEGTLTAAYILLVGSKNYYAFSQWGAITGSTGGAYNSAMTNVSVKVTTGGATTHYINGTQSGSAGTLTVSGYGSWAGVDVIGSSRNGADGSTSAQIQGYGLRGYMEKLVIFSSILSDADRNIVEAS